MTTSITAEYSGFGEWCASWYHGIPAPVPTASPTNQSSAWRVRTVFVWLHNECAYMSQLIAVVKLSHRDSIDWQ